MVYNEDDCFVGGFDSCHIHVLSFNYIKRKHLFNIFIALVVY